MTSNFNPVPFRYFTPLGMLPPPGSAGAKGKEGDTDVPDSAAERKSWQDCYNSVKQQQNAAALQMLEVVEQSYPKLLGIGAWLGGVGGLIIAGFISTYLGAHIGALVANEWHTDAVLLLNIIANLPPKDSVVAAICGPRPGN